MTRRGLVRKDRAGNRRGAIGTAAGALLSLAVLAVGAASASAESLVMNFTEARANIGTQILDDPPLFAASDVATLTAEIDPATGEITDGTLTVPQFKTDVDEFDGPVVVDFNIGTITGQFDKATGALELSGTAGGTLTADDTECTVSAGDLTLTTSDDNGNAERMGQPFAFGLTGAGAIAGEWANMTAVGVGSCGAVEDRIEGPGGIWLEHAGDVVRPGAPLLVRTNPASPSQSGNVRIVGSAEAGSTVRVYDNATCSGDPVATGTAAELAAPGLAVTVAEGATATFAATATDAAGNMSDCSAPIGYQRLKPPPANDDPKPPVKPDPPKPRPCVVPKLAGKTLPQARKALKRANCKVGKVTRTKRAKQLLRQRGGKRVVLVVRSFSPRRGARPANRKVSLKLGPKPSKAGGRRR